ncbi:hypothetical protein GCM10009839_17830 [Catenulispora yoronensis]|uniref:Uncharacterized protein n=1 Tax=Catenulispora yoronensis TaxID=450799 RepID=A0ABN2TUQ6_9ACTN
MTLWRKGTGPACGGDWSRPRTQEAVPMDAIVLLKVLAAAKPDAPSDPLELPSALA